MTARKSSRPRKFVAGKHAGLCIAGLFVFDVAALALSIVPLQFVREWMLTPNKPENLVQSQTLVILAGVCLVLALFSGFATRGEESESLRKLRFRGFLLLGLVTVVWAIAAASLLLLLLLILVFEGKNPG